MRAPLQGSTVVITGASSGIGRELARQLAGRARVLVLAARRGDRLEALRGELLAAHPELRVEVVACDLTKRDGCDRLVTAAGDVDVLVNNAGMGDFSLYDLSSWDKTEQMIDINVRALAYLTRRMLPGMLARRRGGILNMSSGFGLEWLPGFSAYAGTKHFVTAFSEALRLEARTRGVVVTQVCPGPVHTEFEELTGNFTGRRIPGFVELSAEDCARAALRGFERGRALVVPGILFKLILGLGAISPRWLKRLVFRPLSARIRLLQERAQPVLEEGTSSR